MTCGLADLFLHAYLDGELSASYVLEFEQHARKCELCSTEILRQDILRCTMQMAQLFTPAPAKLRRKLRRQIRLNFRAAEPNAPARGVSLADRLLPWRTLFSRWRNQI